MKSFDDYSQEHVNFYEPGLVPSLIKKAIALAKEKKQSILLADVGCGDANILHQILFLDLLTKKEILGIEPSLIRHDRASQKVPIIKGHAEKIPAKDNTFDVLLSNQVIEHIPDEQPFLTEVQRVLKKDGLFYVSSVVKKPWGIWIYRKDGVFVSDPTHYREYASSQVFQNIIARKGFSIVDVRCTLFKHPVIDLFLRLLIKLHLLSPKKAGQIYERHPFLFFLRNLFKLPMVGFYNIEVLAKNR